MENNDFERLCKEIVVDYFNKRVEITDDKKITEKDVYVVWMCKTLQNNKALVSTTVSDGKYYEITYNGDKEELYFDAYKKWENKAIRLSDIISSMHNPVMPKLELPDGKQILNQLNKSITNVTSSFMN